MPLQLFIILQDLLLLGKSRPETPILSSAAAIQVLTNPEVDFLAKTHIMAHQILFTTEKKDYLKQNTKLEFEANRKPKKTRFSSIYTDSVMHGEHFYG